jgi:hypothetical protein
MFNKIQCGNNHHLNQQQQQIHLLPLVAHRYVITLFCIFIYSISCYVPSGNFLFRVLYYPHTFLGYFFFSRFLSLCLSNANILNPLFFFLSLSLSSLPTNQLTMIYLHSPTFSSFFFRLTIAASNTISI